MPEARPIGIFDSGVGGLTVAAEICNELPNEDIVYFGDSRRCPYGDRDPADVVQFSIQVCDFLYSRGVKMLVIACNTATAVALPSLVARYDVPVIGVIQPGAKAATHLAGVRRIGVIGTAVTIASGAYEAAIRARLPKISVFSLACPAFVPLVERGCLSGPEVELVVQKTLEPIIGQCVDTLILGCTHYPLLQPVIANVMGNRVTVISSAEETALEVRRQLERERQTEVKRRKSRRVYYTSGDVDSLQFALKTWFQMESLTDDVIFVNLAMMS